jgi:hypothetical protein
MTNEFNSEPASPLASARQQPPSAPQAEPEPETEADALWRKIRDYHLKTKPRPAQAAGDAAPPVRRRRRGLEFRGPRLQDGADRLPIDG